MPDKTEMLSFRATKAEIKLIEDLRYYKIEFGKILCTIHYREGKMIRAELDRAIISIEFE